LGEREYFFIVFVLCFDGRICTIVLKLSPTRRVNPGLERGQVCKKIRIVKNPVDPA
jgi:hypothetical protein